MCRRVGSSGNKNEYNYKLPGGIRKPTSSPKKSSFSRILLGLGYHSLQYVALRIQSVVPFRLPYFAQMPAIESPPIVTVIPLEQGKIMATASKVIVVANKSVFLQHITNSNSPEKGERVEVIEKTLRRAKLMNDSNTILPRKATEQEILLAHSKEYKDDLESQVEQMQKERTVSKTFGSRIIPDVWGDFDISKDTYEVSLFAAGAPLTAIEYIQDEKNLTSRAFCIVRPPGHHAHHDTGSGFCVFNNVAIAANYLTQKLNFNRVLIVDWDAHHGEGTQELVEEKDNNKIFYFSTHKSTAKDDFYPGKAWGSPKEALHKNILNCPISGNSAECREQILQAFETQLVASMKEYQPEFVLISCGFDAHKSEKYGLGLTNEDFATLTAICVAIAEKYSQGKIVSVLEGGYQLDTLGNAAKAHVTALGQPAPEEALALFKEF